MYIRIGQIGLTVTTQLMPICLATVQSYEDTEKKLLTTYNQNLGAWQLRRIYNRCKIYEGQEPRWRSG